MAKQKRRDLFQLMSAGMLASLAIPARAGKLTDATKLPAAAKVSQESFGSVRVYFDGPTDQLKAMTAGSVKLNAGMEPHPPHQHPEEEIMVVSEGTGDIVVDGKVTPAVPGTMMYCAANKLHGIKNTGKSPLLFYYFKWKA
jgi:mannose-6-phosphate isomerase-like protein (cupin superfamily)